MLYSLNVSADKVILDIVVGRKVYVFIADEYFVLISFILQNANNLFNSFLNVEVSAFLAEFVGFDLSVIENVVD